MTGKTPFSAEAWKNVDWLRQATDCFDLTIRSVNVNDRQCLLVFVGGVTGTTSIEPIVESLVFDKGNLAFFPATVTQAGSLEDALDKVLPSSAGYAQMPHPASPDHCSFASLHCPPP